MRVLRLLLIAGLGLICAAPRTAWAQAAALKDEIEDAIQTLKAAGGPDAVDAVFPLKLESARKLLVQRRGESLSRVLPLLDINDPAIRVNAALVLAEMSQAGEASPALSAALKRCAADSTWGVAYWGFQGLMSNSMPEAEREAALAQFLTSSRPRSVRLAAAFVAGEKKMKSAIPLIVEHMKTILAEYRKQVESKLTYEVTETLGGEATAAPGAPAAPGLPSVPTPGTMPGRTPSPERPGAASGELTTVPRAKVTRHKIDPDSDKISIQEKENYILVLQKLPAVAEMHQMGLVLEELVRTVAPQDALFGFDSSAPWALDRCAESAIRWFEENRAKLWPAAPAAPVEKKPAPAPSAAEKPAT